MDNGLKPVLRIIHVSDMHLIHDDFQKPREVESIIKLTRALEQSLDSGVLNRILGNESISLTDVVRNLESGLTGHAKDGIKHVLSIFEDLGGDEEWKDLPTWLVDTGDVSSYGDDQSLNMGKDLLKEMAQALGDVPYVSIHGNHDAWPENQPFLSDPSTIATHRECLRSNHFAMDYPCHPLSMEVPGTDSRISVYCLNSVVHERIINGLARGEIKHDKWWETEGSPSTGEQIHQFRDLVASDDSTSRDLRILLTHHPVLQPEADNYRFSMYLVNRESVARNLGLIPGYEEKGLLCHLILSGHTHRVFPAPNEPDYSACETLTVPGSKENIYQLVAGSLLKKFPYHSNGSAEGKSLSEMDLFTDKCPQSFQVLRLYLNEQKRFIMKRDIAVRKGGIGRFRFYKKRDSPNLSLELNTDPVMNNSD